MGGSAGAIEALGEIVPCLGPGSPPVLVVVHLPPDVPSLLPVIFARRASVEVVEALDKQPLVRGQLTFAPPDYHLLVEDDASIALSRDPAVNLSRPAIDPLFESAAAVFGPSALAVLLSGANHDGVSGLREIRRAGGRTFVQDPRTAVSPEMPRAALAQSLADLILSPHDIGLALRALAKEHSVP
jgi:two-component system, chemotaxis family, protein-glutamate methylesterase/glutaminase